MRYYIRAKTEAMKKAGALDLSSGCVVSNLMYASFFDQANQAIDVAKKIASDNHNKGLILSVIDNQTKKPVYTLIVE